MSNGTSLKSVFTHGVRELRRFKTTRSIAAKPVAFVGGSRRSQGLRALRRTRPALVAFVVVTLLTSVFVWRHVLAANILWSSAGGSAWLTTTNWTGSAVPTGTDVAQFGVNPTAATGAGINFNGTTNAGPQINGQKIEEVGAVEITSARVAAMLIGNSSTTVGATGTFRLNGAAVNSVAHTIIRNNSSQLLTIQNTQGTGTQTMSAALNDATDNIINIDSTGGITISSIIKDAGGNHITLGGGGAGTLTLSGANTYTGGTTINSAKVTATASGALGAGNVTVNTTGVGLTLQGAINTHIASTATVTVATGAMVALNQTGGSNAVAGLVLGGVTQTNLGTYGSSASGAANQFDSFFTGTGTLTLAAPIPTLNINDVTQAETDSGQTTFNFTVSLTSPAGVGGVTFDASTADGTANAPDDYTALVNQPGSITAGNSSTTVTVMVNGDPTPETNETFFVNISNIVGATPGDVQGLGTILNDDFTLTPIHTIQGSGSTSPLVATSVTTSGIVTGTKSNGFFLQEPDATVDADPNTSEGIFVFTSSAPPAAAVIGNLVQVTGTVQEFIPAADPNSPPTTELITPTVVQLSTGNPLPTAHILTAAETTAPSGTANPLDSLEEFEGMRVTVPSLTVTGATQGTITEPSATVASNGVFIGVITGVPRPFREQGIAISDPLPSGAPVTIPRFDENPERIRVDSDAQPGTTAIDVAAGTVITGITGPLDYAFRCYTIDPDAATPPVVGVQPGSTPVPAETLDEVSVASFNMERFFDTVDDPATSDPILTAAAFNRRVAKASLIIRTIQRYPDVIGVQEVENLSTLQAVATKINTDAVALDALPNPNYAPYLIEGNDVGGIDVGFLVKQSRVAVLNVTQFGQATIFTNPNSSTALLNDRPPLVLQASCPRTGPGGGNLPFTVIVNHLRSLSGVDDATAGTNGWATEGDRVRNKRRAQAEYLANLIQARQVADPTELIITLGDMNAFNVNDGYVDSIGTIKGTPAPASQVTLASPDLVNPDLTDLIDILPAAQQYSYNFDGNAQTLDHIILNHKALVFLTRFAYARDDSDFAVKNYESTNDLRLSDHDQPVAYFSLTLEPTAANGAISGRVTDNHGAPVPGSVVQLEGAQSRRTITDSSGNYHFDNLATGGFYSVTPTRANYVFSPGTRSFSLSGNRSDAVFTGTSSGDTANPLDTAEYFVRQQYLDLLGREPDEAGFNYWSDQINRCGVDNGCASARRRDVAAAFFIEQEFQLTGSFVYGLYEGSLGRRPAFAEYWSDRQQVVGGSDLETRKQAFAESFVQRTEFRNRYQSNLTAESFVDTLTQNLRQTTGVDLGSQRDNLISRYQAGTSLDQSRSFVLRDLTETSSFREVEYNAAFVLTEYFAYLRRDPDPEGYSFWLNVLNSTDSGNYGGMVCGFINSVEYQQRFSTVVTRSDHECSR